MKKVISKLFSVLLLATVLTSCIPVNAKSTTNPALSVSNITMIPLEKYDINVKNKIANSTYKWKSSNNKIVKVNEKNGKIQALKTGEATITCSITTNSNKSYKLTSKVVVNDKPIFFTYGVMSHALGGLAGKYKYNNALEGLQQSLEIGYDFIEVDLVLTKDNKLVCSHGWSENTYEDTGVEYNAENPVMTYKEFMNTKIQGQYTTIDANYIYKTMKENPNILFEFDLRTLTNEEEIRNTAIAIKEVFGTDKSITDRILVQVGNKQMYDIIEEVCDYRYYQYFVHKAELKTIDKLIKYCKSEDVVSVAIKEDYLTEKILQKFKENGLCVLIHTIDDSELAQKWLNKGVDTVCTNFITPGDIN